MADKNLPIFIIGQYFPTILTIKIKFLKILRIKIRIKNKEILIWIQ
jgi:hypothetical protein